MSLNKYHLASIILLVSFIILSLLVSPRLGQDNSPLVIQDQSAFLLVNNSHYPALDQPMILLTKYGRELVWPAATALIFVFGGRSGRRVAVIMAIAMLVSLPLGSVAKEIVARPRPTIPPSDFLIAAGSDFAFPSGHSLVVSAGAGVVLALFRGSSRRTAVSLALATEAALVCVSRVYVGGHYPLDVVGGVLLGLSIAFALTGFSKQIDSFLNRIM
ncbi:MAG: phosphatase PAP2 family protein [Thaumarchaeota archaeon]|nr:phosphatase PAP2 family protein [Nitrososphaerota archaeon]MCL5318038.1 phosphatase PAP2 family protein [Nitrososphaerota archaeon]